MCGGTQDAAVESVQQLSGTTVFLSAPSGYHDVYLLELILAQDKIVSPYHLLSMLNPVLVLLVYIFQFLMLLFLDLYIHVVQLLYHQCK